MDHARPVHGLFQRRVAGDDALLELARLRFAQMGLAAEVYAGTPGELDHVLRFVPPHPYLPVVHLDRGVNVLEESGRAVVGEFASRFAGRIAGLVVHDKHQMGEQTGRLLEVMRQLDARLREQPDGPLVFLEYPPAWHRDGLLRWRSGSATRNGSVAASTSATSGSGRRRPGSGAATLA